MKSISTQKLWMAAAMLVILFGLGASNAKAQVNILNYDGTVSETFDTFEEAYEKAAGPAYSDIRLQLVSNINGNINVTNASRNVTIDLNGKSISGNLTVEDLGWNSFILNNGTIGGDLNMYGGSLNNITVSGNSQFNDTKTRNFTNCVFNGDATFGSAASNAGSYNISEGSTFGNIEIYGGLKIAEASAPTSITKLSLKTWDYQDIKGYCNISQIEVADDIDADEKLIMYPKHYDFQSFTPENDYDDEIYLTKSQIQNLPSGITLSADNDSRIEITSVSLSINEEWYKAWNNDLIVGQEWSTGNRYAQYTFTDKDGNTYGNEILAEYSPITITDPSFTDGRWLPGDPNIPTSLQLKIDFKETDGKTFRPFSGDVPADISIRKPFLEVEYPTIITIPTTIEDGDEYFHNSYSINIKEQTGIFLSDGDFPEPPLTFSSGTLGGLTMRELTYDEINGDDPFFGYKGKSIYIKLDQSHIDQIGEDGITITAQPGDNAPFRCRPISIKVIKSNGIVIINGEDSYTFNEAVAKGSITGSEISFDGFPDEDPSILDPINDTEVYYVEEGHQYTVKYNGKQFTFICSKTKPELDKYVLPKDPSNEVEAGQTITTIYNGNGDDIKSISYFFAQCHNDRADGCSKQEYTSIKPEKLDDGKFAIDIIVPNTLTEGKYELRTYATSVFNIDSYNYDSPTDGHDSITIKVLPRPTLVLKGYYQLVNGEEYHTRYFLTPGMGNVALPFLFWDSDKNPYNNIIKFSIVDNPDASLFQLSEDGKTLIVATGANQYDFSKVGSTKITLKAEDDTYNVGTDNTFSITVDIVELYTKYTWGNKSSTDLTASPTFSESMIYSDKSNSAGKWGMDYRIAAQYINNGSHAYCTGVTIGSSNNPATNAVHIGTTASTVSNTENITKTENGETVEGIKSTTLYVKNSIVDKTVSYTFKAKIDNTPPKITSAKIGNQDIPWNDVTLTILSTDQLKINAVDDTKNATDVSGLGDIYYVITYDDYDVELSTINLDDPVNDTEGERTWAKLTNNTATSVFETNRGALLSVVILDKVGNRILKQQKIYIAKAPANIPATVTKINQISLPNPEDALYGYVENRKNPNGEDVTDDNGNVLKVQGSWGMEFSSISADMNPIVTLTFTPSDKEPDYTVIKFSDKELVSKEVTVTYKQGNEWHNDIKLSTLADDIFGTTGNPAYFQSLSIESPFAEDWAVTLDDTKEDDYVTSLSEGSHRELRVWAKGIGTGMHDTRFISVRDIQSKHFIVDATAPAPSARIYGSTYDLPPYQGAPLIIPITMADQIVLKADDSKKIEGADITTSGVDAIYYKWGTDAFKKATFDEGSTTQATIDPVSGATDLTIYAEDKAGNKSAEVTYSFDINKMEIEYTGPTHFYYINGWGDFEFPFTYSDDVESIKLNPVDCPAFHGFNSTDYSTFQLKNDPNKGETKNYEFKFESNDPKYEINGGSFTIKVTEQDMYYYPYRKGLNNAGGAPTPESEYDSESWCSSMFLQYPGISDDTSPYPVLYSKTNSGEGSSRITFEDRDFTEGTSDEVPGNKKTFYVKLLKGLDDSGNGVYTNYKAYTLPEINIDQTFPEVTAKINGTNAISWSDANAMECSSSDEIVFSILDPKPVNGNTASGIKTQTYALLTGDEYALRKSDAKHLTDWISNTGKSWTAIPTDNTSIDLSKIEGLSNGDYYLCVGISDNAGNEVLKVQKLSMKQAPANIPADATVSLPFNMDTQKALRDYVNTTKETVDGEETDVPIPGTWNIYIGEDAYPGSPKPESYQLPDPGTPYTVIYEFVPSDQSAYSTVTFKRTTQTIAHEFQISVEPQTLNSLLGIADSPITIKAIDANGDAITDPAWVQPESILGSSTDGYTVSNATVGKTEAKFSVADIWQKYYTMTNSDSYTFTHDVQDVQVTYKQQGADEQTVSLTEFKTLSLGTTNAPAYFWRLSIASPFADDWDLTFNVSAETKTRTEGKYSSLNIWAKDLKKENAGWDNQLLNLSNINIIVDGTAPNPSAQIGATALSASTSNSILVTDKITLSADDSNGSLTTSGLKEIWYRWETESVFSKATFDEGSTTQATINPVLDAEFLAIYAIDNAGNQSAEVRYTTEVTKKEITLNATDISKAVGFTFEPQAPTATDDDKTITAVIDKVTYNGNTDAKKYVTYDDQTGEITISGKDVNYNDISITWKLSDEDAKTYQLSSSSTTSQKITVVDVTTSTDNMPKSNSWTNSAITITAPEGYIINTQKDEGNYEDAITFSDGTDQEISYYLRQAYPFEQSNKITLATGVSIDTEAPHLPEGTANAVTFSKQEGMLLTDQITIAAYTDNFADKGSISQMKYIILDGQNAAFPALDNKGWTSYTETMTTTLKDLGVSTTGYHTIYTYAEDKAGNAIDITDQNESKGNSIQFAGKITLSNISEGTINVEKLGEYDYPGQTVTFAATDITQEIGFVETVEVKSGETPIVCTKNDQGLYEFQMPDGDVTVTVGRETAKFWLTITYQTPDGIEAPGQYKEKLEYNQDYEVPSPRIDGCIVDNEVVTGTMELQDVSLIVKYQKDLTLTGDTIFEYEILSGDEITIGLLNASLIEHLTADKQDDANAPQIIQSKRAISKSGEDYADYTVSNSQLELSNIDALCDKTGWYKVGFVLNDGYKTDKYFWIRVKWTVKINQDDTLKPESPSGYCKNETANVKIDNMNSTLPLADDNHTIKLKADNGKIWTAKWVETPTEQKIIFDTDENMPEGTNDYKITFVDDSYENYSDPVNMQAKMKVASDKIMLLYDDVIFVNNGDGDYQEPYQWKIGGQVVPGQTMQFMETGANYRALLERPQDDNAISVELTMSRNGETVESCWAHPASEIETLGMADGYSPMQAKADIKIAPNPAQANTEFQISLTNYTDAQKEKARISIFNETGRVVKTLDPATETATASLPSGIYTIVDTQNNISVKVIVE